MSFTKPIPNKLIKEMEKDSFYQVCCLTGKFKGRGVKIEWHHNFETYQYGNKGRLNEKWCIIPVIKELHDDETLKKYSKCLDLIKLRERLNQQYGDKEVREKIIEKYICL